MKQGNQFWYGIKLTSNEQKLDIDTIKEVVFNFDDITKTYKEGSDEVTYDAENNIFKIRLTQEDTLKMKSKVRIDARVKFKNDDILGPVINEKHIFDSLNKEVI